MDVNPNKFRTLVRHASLIQETPRSSVHNAAELGAFFLGQAPICLINVRTNQYESSTAIAQRWGVHPSSVLRIMRRYGFSGAKMGPSRNSPRRFKFTDVTQVEALFRQ